MHKGIVITTAALGAVLAACVPQSKYDLAIKDAQQAHAEMHKKDTDAAKQAAANKATIDGLKGQIDGLGKQLLRVEEELAAAQKKSADLQAKLDDATAQDAALRKELDKLGHNADKLLAEKGTLASALADAKARLEELRKAQSDAEARAALFKQVALKLQKMVDSGQLKVVLRHGRMVIQLESDVLFDSGQVRIKPRGRAALREVAKVLASVNRDFQVAGDTDNVPISTARFPSNWELSTARAVEVARFLVAQGMKPQKLSAAGYAEFDPVASNATAEGRAKNRRIEITLQPNLADVQLPAVK